MNLARFNGSLRTARINAEQHLPALEAAYERLVRQAGRDAATALVQSAEVTPMVAATSEGNPGWQIPPEGVLLAVTVLAQRSLNRLAKLHRQIVRATAEPPLARLGIAWDITHPLSQTLLERTGSRTGARLGNTVRPVLTEIVAQAYADGLPVRDAAALIRQKIGEAAPGQAQMLARTDLNSLSNGGSVMAAQMVGVTYKTWITAEDSDVRPEHAEADGQTVPIDQPFDVCGEQLAYPGDPSASDACSCNCRCSVTYTLDEDEPLIEPSVTASGRVPSLGMAKASAGFRGGKDLFARVSADLAASHSVTLDEAVSRLTARIPTRGFAAATVPAPAAVAWVSDLAFEGAATADGRYILPDALDWRDLPLSLGAMFDTPHADVVNASPVVGRIDRIEKADTDMDDAAMAKGVRAIRGYGEFDMGGEDGANVARMVADETLRGVSIDLAVDEWTFRDPDTGDLIDPNEASDEDMERAFFGEFQYAVVAGTIMAATVCPTPAFADARIALTASADGRRVMRLWAPISLVASGNGKLDECTDARTAGVSGLESGRVVARGFAKPATPEGARRVHYRRPSALSADASLSGGAGDSSSAEPASDRENSGFSASETERLKERPESDSGSGTPKRPSAGRQLLVERDSPTPTTTDARQESMSPGTNSKRSWRNKNTPARSAATPSHTSREKELSRTRTSTTRREPPNSEAGSVALAIEGLVASATTQKRSNAQRITFVAPLKPPRAWFLATELPGPTPLTVGKEGRVFGHIALWETCHTGFEGACVRPPRSETGYRSFHVGALETAEGDELAIGKLMLGAKHAPLDMNPAAAARHYDDHGMVGAYVRAYDGDYGIWVAGSLRHDLPADRLRDFRANPPSGDWRSIGGRLELIATLAVPVPGFPVPRANAGLVASGDAVEVSSLVATPGMIEPSDAVLSALVAAGMLAEPSSGRVPARGFARV